MGEKGTFESLPDEEIAQWKVRLDQTPVGGASADVPSR